MYETKRGIACNGSIELAYELTYPLEEAAVPQPALVFVGGWGEGGRTWGQEVAYFAPRYPTLTYDRRGLGASSKPAHLQAYTVEQEITDLDAVLAAAGLEQAKLWLVGHSYGGHLLISWLAAKSDNGSMQVQKMALATPTARAVRDAETPFGCFTEVQQQTMMQDLLTGNYAGMVGYAREAIPEGGEATEPLRRAIGRLVPGVMSAETATWIFTHYYYLDLRPLLGRLNLPILVISGELDPTMPPTAGADLVRRLPNARQVVLPQVGHLFHLTTAAALNRQLEAFFEQ